MSLLKPLLKKTVSDSQVGTSPRHRRWSSIDSLSDLSQPVSTTVAVENAAKQTVEYGYFAFKLWAYLGLGWRWIINFWRLVLFATFLMPGFMQMIIFYFTSPRVSRSVPYGRKQRQRLDLFIPKAAESTPNGVPVVIFVTGGAWTIGYKAWGALLGKRLCENGILCACLDYRNFPQANAMQMVEDVNTGIAWVLRKIERYGGDPYNVHLCGQSAGGQLSALALLKQAEQAASGQAVLGAAPVWHPLDIKTFIGVSGAYELEGLADHLHRRGLYKDLLATIMSIDGQVAYQDLSPVHVARTMAATIPGLSKFMPDVFLIHGDADHSVPHDSSIQLHQALLCAQVRSQLRVYHDKNHTQFLLEDAMCDDSDPLLDVLLTVIRGREEFHPQPRMVPALLGRLATKVCPF